MQPQNARPYTIYDVAAVQAAQARAKAIECNELDFFYENMLNQGGDRILSAPTDIHALDPLYEECPNFSEVLDDLTRYLGLSLAGGAGLNVMPLLLLGDPGVGKTHFGKRLAKALGTEFEFISMNALSAGFVITGSSSSWRGAKCGKVAERLVRGQHANPVILLDEVEKANGSAQSDPIAALYQLLEPETSCNFHDEFIDLDIDASQIFWILTANSTTGIPPALLSRMAIYEVPAPTPEQAAGIAQRMYGSLLRELNLQAMMAGNLCSTVLDRMATISPREMRKALLDALGVAVAGKRDVVTPDDFRIKGQARRKIGF